MVDINRLIDETEKLSLLPDRLYLILKPVNDDKGGFDMMAYDTTDPKKSLSPAFYVLKGIMEMMNTDLDRLVSLGQMSIMDRIVDIQNNGETPTTETVDDESIELVNIGKKH